MQHFDLSESSAATDDLRLAITFIGWEYLEKGVAPTLTLDTERLMVGLSIWDKKALNALEELAMHPLRPGYFVSVFDLDVIIAQQDVQQAVPGVVMESPQPGLPRRYPSIFPNVFEGFFPILSHSMPPDLPIKSSTMPQVA